MFLEAVSSLSILLQPVYWQADGDGLAYVAKMDSSTNPSFRGKWVSPNFEWDMGFQVAFSCLIPHDEWKLSLGLKHIHTNANGHCHASEQIQLLPLIATPNALDRQFVDEAQAHWRLHLGLLDGLVSKTWNFSRSTGFTLAVGLRSAWIRQKFQLAYSGGDWEAVEGLQLSMKNKFWGIGPALKLSSDWRLRGGWSIFGECLFAILYGQFYVHQAEWEMATKQDILGIHEVFSSSVPTVDASLGLRWTSSAQRWAMEVAWDQVLLCGQNQWFHLMEAPPSSPLVSNQGALNLHGVYAGVKWAF